MSIVVAIATGSVTNFCKIAYTRSVRNIFEKLCGLEVSAMQVSRATKMLDEEFEKWRNRPIRETVKYLLLDARYEKVRVDGNVVDCALLIAYGIYILTELCITILCKRFLWMPCLLMSPFTTNITP